MLQKTRFTALLLFAAVAASAQEIDLNKMLEEEQKKEDQKKPTTPKPHLKQPASLMATPLKTLHRALWILKFRIGLVQLMEACTICLG